MGTNYYFITKNSKFAHKYFATKSDYGNYYYDGEYELCDNPYLRFEIHLNKCSCGWRPIFQIHKAFDTFNKLEEFYYKHQKQLKIVDEYDIEYTFEEYKNKIIRHATCRDPKSQKWVYGVPEFEKKYATNPRPRLHLVDCSPEEADIWIPYNHLEYVRTEREASRKYGVWERWMSHDTYYSHNDPDYPFDWSEGEFS